MTNRFVLIIAGGVGSRFWPASREDKPKQFLDMLGTGKSLLRLTFERCLKLVPAERIFVVTNEKYTGDVAKHIPEISAAQIFPEPSRNNTAPCIAYASLKLKKRFEEGVCLVAPSDHLIEDEEGFVAKAEQAMAYATENDALVTLGITPTRPDTGYGYIHFGKQQEVAGIHRVQRFTEKPDKTTAEQFLVSGEYLWNSGMFVWSLDSVLRAFESHAKGTYDILSEGYDSYDTDAEEEFLRHAYPTTEKTSIDYAIMEKADNVFVVPASFGWSDLGTWTSLHEKLTRDAQGNAAVHGPVILDQCGNVLVHTEDGRLVVGAGLEDLVIVSEGDVTLVFRRDREQDVKKLREEIERRGWKRYL